LRPADLRAGRSIFLVSWVTRKLRVWKALLAHSGSVAALGTNVLLGLPPVIWRR